VNQPAKPFSRRSPEQWQNIIDQQLESGLSQKAFCQSQGISLATFTNWKRKLKYPDESATHHQPKQHRDWIEFETHLPEQSPGTDWHMELELPGGVVLRIRR